MTVPSLWLTQQTIRKFQILRRGSLFAQEDWQLYRSNDATAELKHGEKGHVQDHKGTVRSEETKEAWLWSMAHLLRRALGAFTENSKTDLVVFIRLSRRSRPRFYPGTICPQSPTRNSKAKRMMDACAHDVTTTFLSSFTAEVAVTFRIGGKVPMMKMIDAGKRRRVPS